MYAIRSYYEPAAAKKPAAKKATASKPTPAKKQAAKDDGKPHGGLLDKAAAKKKPTKG